LKGKEDDGEFRSGHGVGKVRRSIPFGTAQVYRIQIDDRASKTHGENEGKKFALAINDQCAAVSPKADSRQDYLQDQSERDGLSRTGCAQKQYARFQGI
jgi:hypothetical protein